MLQYSEQVEMYAFWNHKWKPSFSDVMNDVMKIFGDHMLSEVSTHP